MEDEMNNDPRMLGASLDDPNFDSNQIVGKAHPYPKLAPRDFELVVKQQLDADGDTVADYSSTHREFMDSSDGTYEIDIVIRFGFAGLNYVTLVECKAYGSPVKREKVAELWAKVQSLGAHKGILFSTSGFQSGALKFALQHGIGLVHVADKMTSVLAKARTDPPQNFSEATRADDVCCWLVQGTMVSLLQGENSPSLFRLTNADSDKPEEV
jgi:restriction system protein